MSNIYKPNLKVRPSSGATNKSKNSVNSQNTSNFNKTIGVSQNNNDDNMDLGLGITGNKIKKGYKVPEKYQISKPDFKKRGSFHNKQNEDNNINNNSQSNEFLPYRYQNNEQILNQQVNNQQQCQSQEYSRQLTEQDNLSQQNQKDKESDLFDSFVHEYEMEMALQQSQNNQNQNQRDNQEIPKKNKYEFKTYMQYKMVNPKVKEIYKENEELKKQTSKPFKTVKGRLNSGKNQQQNQDISQNDSQTSGSTQRQQQQQRPFKQREIRQSQATYISNGSTNLSSNQTATGTQHGQKPSQDLQGFEKELEISDTVDSQSLQQQQQQNQNLNRFKLTELEKERLDQEMAEYREDNQQQNQNNNINYNNWTVQEQAGDRQVRQNLGDRSKQIQELNQFIKKMKNQKKLPKDFEKMVSQNFSKLEADDQNDISTYKFQEIQDDDEQSQLDIQLGEYMLKDQQKKLEQLNKMLEDSQSDISQSQISQEDIQRNLLFLTEINRKKGKFSQNTSFLSQKSEKSMKSQQNNTEDEEEQKSQISESEKMYKDPKDEYFIRLNKQLAWHQEDEKIEAQMMCNRLPEEAQQRLESLLDNIENFKEEEEYTKLMQEKNPFNDCLEESKVIEDKISEVRSELVLDEDQQDFNTNQGILDENVLPKDKNLREEAEERILQEKLKDVNNRLYDHAKDQMENKNKINKQQIQGLCQRYKEQVEYQPGPLLQVRMQEFQELGQTNQELEDKLVELKKQESILDEFQAIKEKIDDNLKKIKRGEIIEIESQKKKLGNVKLEILKQLNVNTGISEQEECKMHEYTVFKNEIDLGISVINKSYQECSQKEDELNLKINKWKEEMQIFDLEVEKQEQCIEDEEMKQQKEVIKQLDIDLLDQEIEEKVLQNNPDLQVFPDIFQGFDMQELKDQQDEEEKQNELQKNSKNNTAIDKEIIKNVVPIKEEENEFEDSLDDFNSLQNKKQNNDNNNNDSKTGTETNDSIEQQQSQLQSQDQSQNDLNLDKGEFDIIKNSNNKQNFNEENMY